MNNCGQGKGVPGFPPVYRRRRGEGCREFAIFVLKWNKDEHIGRESAVAPVDEDEDAYGRGLFTREEPGGPAWPAYHLQQW